MNTESVQPGRPQVQMHIYYDFEFTDRLSSVTISGIVAAQNTAQCPSSCDARTTP